MGKKIEKKLTLSKQTITSLSGIEQKSVKAGYITASCPEMGCNTLQGCTAGCPSVNPRYC